jgi:hypothetical protein
MSVGPDFLCIGMQKAGTGWVFDQLQFHPDLWMPPIKELHYLDRETPKFGNARKTLRKAKRAQKRGKPARKQHRREWDDRDVEFLTDALELSGKPIDLEGYANLFKYKRDKLSGDVTPGYSGMQDEVVAAVAKRFPDLKVFLLVRDPVSRLWSQISMANRREKFDRSLLTDPAGFRKFVEEYKPFQKVGFPARIAERWEKFAPNIQFRHFFFDDIATRAAEVRRDILSYLGADPDKSSGDIEPSHNRKAKAEKLEMTDDIKAVIADFFKDELHASAKRFGGHAESWVTRYGV